MSMITPIPTANHYAVANHVNGVQRTFVGTHKGNARLDVDGYNRSREPGDLESFSLQAHRASESIQDKSSDARLSICHMPAYK